MPIRSRRGLGTLRKVLEDWINEDWSDSSDNDELPIRYRNRMTGGMEDKKSDIASSSNSEKEHLATSSEDERMSSRMSNASSRLSNASSHAAEHRPLPPRYESVVEMPVQDYYRRGGAWDREVDQIMGDFGQKCSTAVRDADRFHTLPNKKRTSSGAQSYTHEEAERGSMSPPRSSSTLGFNRDPDWDRRMLPSSDDFFRDTRLRHRFPSAFDRPFGMTSRFGDDIDRFFGRGYFDSEWDTFFPEVRLSSFGRRGSGGTRPREVDVAIQDGVFKEEVDVKGFEPHELLVKTVGHKLIVMAKTEQTNGEGGVSNRNHEFREVRREFTIPPNVNPTDVTSRLTPEGMLVVEAPTGETQDAIAS